MALDLTDVSNGGHDSTETARFTAFIRGQTAIAATPLVPEIRLHLADEITPLWHATEVELAQAQVPPPFWAFAWSGGQALARHVLDQPDRVCGRRVLDLGTGCGLVAIAAARAGAAEVLAVDIDGYALAATRLNAALNGVDVATAERDLLREPDALDRHLAWDIVLAADLFYEAPMAARATTWLKSQAARGAEVLIGDPGRKYLPRDQVEPVATYTVETSMELEDKPRQETRIWRLKTVAAGGRTATG